MDVLAGADKCNLFLVDFARSSFVVYHTICNQLEDSIVVELTDILEFTDLDAYKKMSDVQERLKKVEDEHHVVVGFSGRVDDDVALTIIRLLQARCSATFLDPQETATLLGGAELVRQFEEKNLENRSILSIISASVCVYLMEKRLNLSLIHGHHPITRKKPFASRVMLQNSMSIFIVVYP